jgi:hypothetical protein
MKKISSKKPFLRKIQEGNQQNCALVGFLNNFLTKNEAIGIIIVRKQVWESFNERK